MKGLDDDNLGRHILERDAVARQKGKAKEDALDVVMVDMH